MRPALPRPRPAGRGAALAALAVAGLATACGGRLRQELGEQVRAITSRLRGASPRERYADALRGEGPAGAQLARDWIAAGDRALAAPAAAPLPLREQGALRDAGGEPVALAWRVRPRRGERVTARVEAAPVDVGREDAARPDPAAADSSGARLFTEFWREDARDPSTRTLVASGEGLAASYDVLADDPGAVYVLRLQPAARARLRWRVAFDAAPSLAFPVAGRDARAVASFFGAARDGGERSHEGVDIMAPRGTPALAAEDGVVQYVGDDRLGGRVVSLAAPGRGHSLYYAHLDSQAVRGGQTMHAGDTVGFVGNTGNARGGPTHLHFGVYAGDGAVDPMPYLDDRRRAPTAPGRDTLLVGRPARAAGRAAVALRAGPSAGAPSTATLAPRTPLVVDGAAGGGWLHVRPAAGDVARYVAGYVPADAVERAPAAAAVVNAIPPARPGAGPAGTGRPRRAGLALGSG